MNNITYPENWGNKTQEHLIAWTPVSSRNPSYDSLFAVTLKDGTSTFDTYSKAHGWTELEVIAWAVRMPAYKPAKEKALQKELAVSG